MHNIPELVENIFDNCSFLNDMPLAFCIIELVFDAGWPWHSSGCRCSISVPGSVEIFDKIYSFLLPLLLTALMPAVTMVVADISHFRALPVSEGA